MIKYEAAIRSIGQYLTIVILAIARLRTGYLQDEPCCKYRKNFTYFNARN